MGMTVEEVLAELDPAERRKVEQMSAELIAEEMTLRDFRKARQLTRVSVAGELGVTLGDVSQLEQQTDILLSTLRRTVEAMGGRLTPKAQCAVERRVIPVGANPTQPLSLRLEAARAVYGGNEVDRSTLM